MATTLEKIREAAVCGPRGFYPSDPDALRREVDQLIADSPTSPKVVADREIIALIAPHAGYRFSGGTAAAAYSCLGDNRYEAVIIVAPSHKDSFGGVSAYPGDGYATPLGILRVDREITRSLENLMPDIRLTELGHCSEHAIEVQLPFIQRTLGDVPIVPLVMSDMSWDICKQLGEAIAEAVGDHLVLIVASSDLYHGESYSDCLESDERVLSAICNGDARVAHRAAARQSAPGTTAACGIGPIVSVMVAAKKLTSDGSTVLSRTNSGDVTGEKTGYVVGYASVAIARQSEGGCIIPISNEDRSALKNAAREAVVAAAAGLPMPTIEGVGGSRLQEAGAFVTLRLESTLRGCLGQMTAERPLIDTVVEMAYAAATRDHRFEPVNQKELESLEIQISVIGPMSPTDHPTDICVGRDGVMVIQASKRGVLLPEVASERGWDAVTFLEMASQKAGLPTDGWKDTASTVLTFQTCRF